MQPFHKYLVFCIEVVYQFASNFGVFKQLHCIQKIKYEKPKITFNADRFLSHDFIM